MHSFVRSKLTARLSVGGNSVIDQRLNGSNFIITSAVCFSLFSADSVDCNKMAGYFGHVGGHVPPYSVGGHGLSHPAPNIDFFSQMAPPPCGKLF